MLFHSKLDLNHKSYSKLRQEVGDICIAWYMVRKVSKLGYFTMMNNKYISVFCYFQWQETATSFIPISVCTGPHSTTGDNY